MDPLLALPSRADTFGSGTNTFIIDLVDIGNPGNGDDRGAGGKTLATGADDRKVKLWNIATEQEMATLEFLRGGCRSLRFSPDGRTLAVGSYLDPNPYMWLWEVPSFEEIAAAEARQNAKVKQP